MKVNMVGRDREGERGGVNWTKLSTNSGTPILLWATLSKQSPFTEF